MIVFLYDGRAEIALLVINIIFIKLFFIMQPIKNKLILFSCLFFEVYLNTILILNRENYIYWELWGGIITLNFFMLVEDVLSQYLYSNYYFNIT